MIELIEAIATLARTQPELTAGLKGGFHLNHAGQANPKPWGLIGQVEDTDYDWTTGNNFLSEPTFQISFFGNHLSEVRDVGRAWKQRLLWKPLPLGSGRAMAVRLIHEGVIDEQNDAGAFSGVNYVLIFSLLQQQSY